MGLSNKEILFLASTGAAILAIIVYFKYYLPSSKCTQGFTYNPSVINLGIHDAQADPIGMEYMTTPPLLINAGSIPYQQSMIANHPMLMTRQQLEDRVALDGFGMGPGMVEGYRFRGNLNL